jgi:hypothetical protein
LKLQRAIQKRGDRGPFDLTKPLDLTLNTFWSFDCRVCTCNGICVIYINEVDKPISHPCIDQFKTVYNGILKSLAVSHNNPIIETIKKCMESRIGDILTKHSVFFGPFLSSSIFPPNDRAQNHAQENPILVLFTKKY